MEIGVFTSWSEDGSGFANVRQFGLEVCQIGAWDTSKATREIAARVVRDASDAGVRISSLWGGWPPPAEWNFRRGPVTLGLVPVEYRAERVAVLKQWADFASWIGAPAVVTHCGFIPENLTDPEYPPVVEAIREIAEHCRERGLGFWFETGQETPVVLLRTIEHVGTGNLGINLDPANLIMYGKGNPIDALDVFGPYVRSIHVKDGLYPTDGEELGREVLVGTGRVRFPEFLVRLKEIGFKGDLIIEREIHGEQQRKDIAETVSYLQSLLEEK